jgi:hypothetical protein
VRLRSLERKEELEKLSKKYKKTDLKKAKEFFRLKGLNLTLEETAFMLENLKQYIPKFTKKPKAQADLLEVRLWKGDKEFTIAEAKAPEVFSTLRKGKRKFKQILSLVGRRGRFAISKVKGKDIYTLSYIGGGHHDYCVLNNYNFMMLSDFFKKREKELYKKRLT